MPPIPPPSNEGASGPRHDPLAASSPRDAATSGPAAAGLRARCPAHRCPPRSGPVHRVAGGPLAAVLGAAATGGPHRGVLSPSARPAVFASEPSAPLVQDERRDGGSARLRRKRSHAVPFTRAPVIRGTCRRCRSADCGAAVRLAGVAPAQPAAGRERPLIAGSAWCTGMSACCSAEPVLRRLCQVIDTFGAWTRPREGHGCDVSGPGAGRCGMAARLPSSRGDRRRRVDAALNAVQSPLALWLLASPVLLGGPPRSSRS